MTIQLFNKNKEWLKTIQLDEKALGFEELWINWNLEKGIIEENSNEKPLLIVKITGKVSDFSINLIEQIIQNICLEYIIKNYDNFLDNKIHTQNFVLLNEIKNTYEDFVLFSEQKFVSNDLIEKLKEYIKIVIKNNPSNTLQPDYIKTILNETKETLSLEIINYLKDWIEQNNTFLDEEQYISFVKILVALSIEVIQSPNFDLRKYYYSILLDYTKLKEKNKTEEEKNNINL